MLVPMRLSRILLSEIADQQVVFLTEVDGDRSFPIIIGRFEAACIERRFKGEQPIRPLTHDLLLSTIEELGWRIDKVVIDDLVDHTYHGKLVVRGDANGSAGGSGGDSPASKQIDCRSSDAIAVAMYVDPKQPIFVEDWILDAVA